jgi:hypothetical protein
MSVIVDETAECAVTSHVVTSVWSSYGHRFYMTDPDAGAEACMTCGAEYYLTWTCDEPADTDEGVHYASGDYRASGGAEPAECSRDTSMVHGWRDENGHDLECPGGQDGTCEHCRHDCPCNLCHG